MKKLLFASVLFLMLVPALPDAREINYFPMDKDLAWVFDDGSVEKIIAFKKLEITVGEGREKKHAVVHLFTFENFNHERRTFYRVGSKVFEWIDGSARLRYDFGADEGAHWEMKWGKIGQGLRWANSLIACISGWSGRVWPTPGISRNGSPRESAWSNGSGTQSPAPGNRCSPK